MNEELHNAAMVVPRDSNLIARVYEGRASAVEQRAAADWLLRLREQVAKQDHQAAIVADFLNAFRKLIS